MIKCLLEFGADRNRMNTHKVSPPKPEKKKYKYVNAKFFRE